MIDKGRALKVLRLKDVQERIGLSRSTIYDRLNPNSSRYDESFPKPISLGGAAIGWVEESVDLWILKRMSVSNI
ncbi:helix-turn-helix transcriptional regulator [Pseudomonas sp. NPDC090202]|uniref:helix-turn-helix transcriptional regulator n=1 Tax=Pseudomonas sp. NPDC090202 TaxID=3364476 RepID=UPI0037F5240B